MSSIRLRLLVRLLALFVVIWLLMAFATWLESREQVEELFDAQLSQAAGVLAQIGGRSLDTAGPRVGALPKSVYGHRYEKNIAFQIWSGDRLLLRSANAPTTPMAAAAGFSYRRIGGGRWRVFRYDQARPALTIYTGEREAVRRKLIGEITRNALYPMSLALPLLGLLIWGVIGRGLAPVRRIAEAVAHRSARNLEPVLPGQPVPAEIHPLIEALNHLFGRLHAAFERERRFTADAAHELRTPLASLRTHAQIAMRARDPAEQQAALQQITRGVDRTTHLVQQLLTLARLDPESAAGDFARVELQHTAAEVLAELDALARERQVELSLDAPQPVPVLGNGTALAVLIRNLVDNAIRYTPAGGSVEVAVGRGPGGAELSVTDSGPGIAELERAQVFDRFYRGRAGAGYGSGLGLSIVRRIAELHEAAVTLETAPGGVGLRVAVSFPRPGTPPAATV